MKRLLWILTGFGFFGLWKIRSHVDPIKEDIASFRISFRVGTSKSAIIKELKRVFGPNLEECLRTGLYAELVGESDSSLTWKLTERSGAVIYQNCTPKKLFEIFNKDPYLNQYKVIVRQSLLKDLKMNPKIASTFLHAPEAMLRDHIRQALATKMFGEEWWNKCIGKNNTLECPDCLDYEYDSYEVMTSTEYTCPDCGSPLNGFWDIFERYTLDRLDGKKPPKSSYTLPKLGKKARTAEDLLA